MCRLGAGCLEQLRVLSLRSVRTRRFEALGVLKFVQFIAVAVVAGLLWLNRAAARNLLAAQDTAALCFFELVRARFVAMPMCTAFSDSAWQAIDVCLYDNPCLIIVRQSVHQLV